MIKFVHTHIISDNWRGLADCHLRVFDCEQLPPERDLKGDWLDRATAIPDARMGISLKFNIGKKRNKQAYENTRFGMLSRIQGRKMG